MVGEKHCFSSNPQLGVKAVGAAAVKDGRCEESLPAVRRTESSDRSASPVGRASVTTVA